MPSGDNSLYNYGPYISPWVTTGNNQRTWEPVVTELAESYIPLLGNSPLKELFPDEIIPERIVEIRQIFEAQNTIFPVVYCGKPDVLVGPNSGTERSYFVQPLYIRESTYLSHCEINYRAMPGSCNEFNPPQAQIDKAIQDMILQHNLTWDVFRAMILTGGIRYTDSRSGVPVNVSSRIPAHNYFRFDNVAGIHGRDESRIFRSIETMDSTNPAIYGVPWTEPFADIVYTVMSLKRWFRDTNKATLTDMYMSPDLRDVLYNNVIVRLSLGAFIPSFGSSQLPLELNRPDPHYSRHIGLSGDMITSIAGITVHTVETEYKDPVDGVTKRVWPKNKVVFVAQQDMAGGRQPIGRTQYCRSEEYLAKPGLWTRMQMETQIPAAPGVYIQMGNAGMPYIRFPHRVVHMTVATVEGVNQRLGLQGNLNFIP